MDLKETWTFLKSGAQYYTDDSYFHETKGAQPEVGEAAIGYRVVYKYGDKIFSPLIDQSYSSSPTAIALNAELKGDDINQVFHTDQEIRPADLSTGPAIGYYYFPDKEQATEYMKAIAVGAKKTFNNSPFAMSTAGGYGDSRGDDVQLALMRVTGTASAKPWDEGAMMNDMKYDTKPELSLSFGTVRALAKSLNKQNEGDSVSDFFNYWKDYNVIELMRQMGTLTDEQKDEYLRRR